MVRASVSLDVTLRETPQNRKTNHWRPCPMDTSRLDGVRLTKRTNAGIIVSMGGQTALNVGIELWRNEDLQRRGIRVLGTKIDAIVATEDREIFSTKLREINETLALSYPATTVEGALEAAHKIGYPVLVRAAFTLGGLGSGFAENDAELRDLAV